VLSGVDPPRNALEWSELAELLQAKSRFPEAASAWSEAFIADPVLADDLEEGYRYDAACCAAMAAASGDSSAADLRRRALEWLREDLDAREEAGLLASISSWKRDPELAGVRDRVDDLPRAERKEWTSLWKHVDALLAPSSSLDRR
jgi:hypothetical protein